MSDDAGRRIALRQSQPHRYANGGGTVCAWCHGPADLACHQQDAEYVEMTEDEMRDMIGAGQVTIGCRQCDYQAIGAGPGEMARDLVAHMVAEHGMTEDEARDGLLDLKVSVYRCARCEARYRTERDAKAALSRADGTSYVCSACGSEEAIMQMAGRPIQPPAEWPVRRVLDPERDRAMAGWRTPDWRDQRSNRTVNPSPVPAPKEVPDLRLHLMERWIPGGIFSAIAAASEAYGAKADAEWERRALRNASLWWIKDEMVDLVAAAATSVPADLQASELDLPAEQAYGLAVLAKPWIGIDADSPDQTVEVNAVLWGPALVEGHPALTFSMYRYLDFAGGLDPRDLRLATETGLIGEARQERIGQEEATGNPAYRLSGGAWAWIGRSDWRMSETLGMIHAPAGPYSSPVRGEWDTDRRRASIEEDRRWFASLCALVNHRLSEEETVYAARQVRRRAERAGVAREAVPSQVRLIRLRQARHEHPEGDEPGDAKKVEWSHRWMVGAATGGTWAYRRCGPKRSQRRLVFIAPYVKGPADKPLVLKENVRVWVK